MTPRRISSRETVLSPWTTLVELTYLNDGKEEIHHVFRPPDYVNILAISSDGHIPLVRQFRPALDRFTLELPGGLLDPGESPENCASRELAEETGFKIGPVIHLGTFSADTGRLANALHAFVATNAVKPDPGWKPEAGVDPVILTRHELKRALDNGELQHGTHVAIVSLAFLKGLV